MEAKARITVSATVDAAIEKVWDYWNAPGHITQWCAASPDWHAPKAENDLRTGGRFATTMAAKDGSFSFDFGGTYTHVVPHNFIAYRMDDGREVSIKFQPEGSKTYIEETFDPESQNPEDMQRGGWQAILDNFKQYCETH